MRAFRTVLEQKIWERRQTLEEFVAYTETYAREHGETGTLGVRHVQRLISGRRSDGRPLGDVRPETARLLEQIFELSIDELLSPPVTGGDPEGARAFRVAVAVVLKSSETLIVCRRGHDGDGLTWQFPAGIVKPGMASAMVAVHETFAETAVHCAPIQDLGSRVHPVTNVLCDYILCDYLTGYARNVDSIENVGVVWADKNKLSSFISMDLVYGPVRDALGLSPTADV